MFLVSALIVSAVVGLVSGTVQGVENREKAKQQRELLKQQLEQTKATNRQNALDTSSYLTLNTAYATDSLNSEIAEYENQINLYASQSQRNIGSANASTALTGFRLSGSNLNAVKNSQSDILSQMKSVYSNIQQSRLSSGQSLANMQTNAMSNLAGYKQNVSHAIQSVELQSEQLGYQDGTWGWDVLKDAGIGMLGGASTYVANRLGSGDKMFGEGSWAWS